MKVSVEQTIEISDEQRYELGAILDQKVKPKRQATRQEIKDFLWSEGASWAVTLQDEINELTGDVPTEDEPYDRVQPEPIDDEDPLESLL